MKASSRVDKFSKSDIIVSPSILSANFAKLGEQVLFFSIFVSIYCFFGFWIIRENIDYVNLEMFVLCFTAKTSFKICCIRFSIVEI